MHINGLKYLLNGGNSTTLNCGYNKGYSVLEVINTVKRISGVDFQVDIEPPRIGDPAGLIANSSKLKKSFKLAPRKR